MPLWLKLIKQICKVLAALLAVIVSLYIILLLINLQDQSPSAAAIRMQQLQHNAAANQDADNNGYLFLFEHEDRVKHQLSERFSTLMRQCDLSDCNTALIAQPELADWLVQHQPIIDFYQQVRSFTTWYEPIPVDAAAVLPSFKSLLNGQQLLLIQAWLAAQQQDTATVQQLLQQDLQFWRSQLPKHNLLLTKLISAAAIKRHFNFAAAIQQQLSPEQYAAMQPPSWLSAFTEQELSMLQVLSGEWVYTNNVTEALLLSDTAMEELSTDNKLAWLILKPFFQPQASRNQRARILLAQANGDDAPEPTWYSWLYNPTGKMLNGMGMDSYTDYHARLAELEVLRQQAVTLSQSGAEL